MPDRPESASYWRHATGAVYGDAAYRNALGAFGYRAEDFIPCDETQTPLPGWGSPEPAPEPEPAAPEPTPEPTTGQARTPAAADATDLPEKADDPPSPPKPKAPSGPAKSHKPKK